jgi:hypothetical protein
MRSNERIAISENVSKHILTTRETTMTGTRIAQAAFVASFLFVAWCLTLNLT